MSGNIHPKDKMEQHPARLSSETLFDGTSTSISWTVAMFGLPVFTGLGFLFFLFFSFLKKSKNSSSVAPRRHRKHHAREDMVHIISLLLILLPLVFSEETHCVLKSPEQCVGVLRSYKERTGSLNPFDGVLTVSLEEATLHHFDADGDGDFDVIIGNRGFDLKYLENIGTLTNSTYVERNGKANPFYNFSYTVTSSISSSNGLKKYDHTSVVSMDLDDDGDLDLIFKGKKGIIYLRNDNRTFNEWEVEAEFYSFFIQAQTADFVGSGRSQLSSISLHGKMNLIVKDFAKPVRV